MAAQNMTTRPIYSTYSFPQRVVLSIALVMVFIVTTGPLIRRASPAISPNPTALNLPGKASRPLSARLAVLAQPGSSAPHTAAQALSLPEHGPGSLITDSADNLLVYIYFDAINQQSLDALIGMGARVVHSSDRYRVATAYVAPAQLQEVAAVPGVTHMQEALAPLWHEQTPLQGGPSAVIAHGAAHENECPPGEIISEGDAQLRAAEARATYGVDGSGVKIGALSGSFDIETATQIHAADDIKSGDLPGPDNPCYALPISELSS